MPESRVRRWPTTVQEFARQHGARPGTELVLGVPIPWRIAEAVPLFTRRITDRIFDCLEKDSVGECTVAAGPFILACDPPTARMVHVAFNLHARARRMRKLRGMTVGGPDLVVQVVAEQHEFAAARAAANDFLGAGTEIVWLIRPWAFQVAVLDRRRELELLTTHDTLRGSWLLPRFRLPLRHLFSIEVGR